MTLLEVVVLVAIVAIVSALGYAALAQRPAQARSTAVAFAALVAQARALAAITGGPDGSGASIAVIREGDDYVATLYAFRPILGAGRAPVAEPNTPPLRTPTALELVQPNGPIEPPFALFFSASGHASAQAPFRVGVDAPLAAEPVCPLETGIVVAFIDGVHNQSHSISCEMAQLDLDTWEAVTVVQP
jgi:type II secretory pathway pseudopilin PulG